MDDLEAYRLENKYPVYGVQSRENGLKYFYDDERRGIVISGMKGKNWVLYQAGKSHLPGAARDFAGNWGGTVNSRRKGKEGELSLARKLREYGYDCRRGG